MSQKCDVLVHVGDTKPGAMPCDEPLMTKSIHILKDAAAKHGKLALYAPGGECVPVATYTMSKVIARPGPPSNNIFV